MGTAQWAAGFSPDLRKWFHNRGWADKPEPEAFSSRQSAAKSAPESFATRDERERQERREREQRALEREVSATEAQLGNRCARHLYRRTWGDCNPKCPEWEGKRNVG